MSNKKTQTIIIAAVAVLFLAMVYHLYGLIKQAGDRWPHKNAPGSLTATIRSLEGEVAKLRQDVEKIPAAKEDLEAKKVEYQLATRVLPRESSFDQLVAAIRTKSQQSEIYIMRLTPTVGGGTPFEEWRFTLDVRGTFDQIASFVNRMEEFESAEPTRVGSEKRFFRLTSISITAEAAGMAYATPITETTVPGSHGHTCTLVMSTFRFTGDE